MDLRTDFTNDIINTSVNEKRKYREIENADGTKSFEDVTVYTQEGSAFGANELNATNEAVNEINKNLTASDNLPFRFATDGEGNYGYLGADDSFIPFKSNDLTLLWKGTKTFRGTINVDSSKYRCLLVKYTGHSNGTECITVLDKDLVLSSNPQIVYAFTWDDAVSDRFRFDDSKVSSVNNRDVGAIYIFEIYGVLAR